MKKIVRTSCILKWSALSLCAALPLIEAGYWITSGYPFLEPLFHFAPLPSFWVKPVTWEDLTALQKLLGFLINMIPLAFSIAALGCLAKLFHAFQHMSLFESENVRTLHRAGKALVLGQLVGHPIYTMLLSLAITYRNPVGQRTISISWGTEQFEILAIGLSILLASWVFQEAVYLREEQQATI